MKERTLVVIDDEAMIIEGIKVMLQRLDLGYELIGFAYDGISGLSLLKDTKPDVVITDIRIPGIDGLSMIEIAKDDLPDTLFIVISGYQEFEYARRALTLSVLSYIDKPITIPKLHQVLLLAGEYLEKKQDIKQESALAHLTDMLIGAIHKNDSERITEICTSILKVAEHFNMEIYQKEMYKLLCVVDGVVAEQKDQRLDMQKHYYDDLKVMVSKQQVAEYVERMLKRLRDKIHIYESGSNHQMVLQTINLIHREYNRDISLVELADRVNLTPCYLSMLFKDEVGVSFIKYLTKIRIEHAKQFLSEGYTVREVCDRTGYNSTRYFVETFKKVTGQTPSEHRGGTRKKISPKE